ncbi:hypothetical protein [Paraburkholderia sacchari]|uniref:hypothetical protein n=1 Tax=Paraburkholderia sacchari TaxID=159450 RepID=UPI003D991304
MTGVSIPCVVLVAGSNQNAFVAVLLERYNTRALAARIAAAAFNLGASTYKSLRKTAGSPSLEVAARPVKILWLPHLSTNSRVVEQVHPPAVDKSLVEQIRALVQADTRQSCTHRARSTPVARAHGHRPVIGGIRHQPMLQHCDTPPNLLQKYEQFAILLPRRARDAPALRAMQLKRLRTENT